MSKPITMLDLCKIAPEKAAERIEALIKRNADLEKELNLTKDIIVAHQIADETGYIDGVGWVENWSEMEEKVFNLLEAHNLDQRYIGIRDTAMQMNNIYVTDNNLRAVPPAQFAWWNRCFGHMIDRAEKLSIQSKALRDES